MQASNANFLTALDVFQAKYHELGFPNYNGRDEIHGLLSGKLSKAELANYRSPSEVPKSDNMGSGHSLTERVWYEILNDPDFETNVAEYEES